MPRCRRHPLNWAIHKSNFVDLHQYLLRDKLLLSLFENMGDNPVIGLSECIIHHLGSSMKLRLKHNAITTLDPNKAQKGEWIKARILLPFSFVILSVIAAFVVTAYLQENGNHERALTEKVAAVERLFRQQLEQDSALMLAAQTALLHDDGLKDVFLGGDRKKLLKRAWPIFDELR